MSPVPHRPRAEQGNFATQYFIFSRSGAATCGISPKSRRSWWPGDGRRVLCVADAHFEVPRLAEIYDPLDPDRRDLDAYAAMAGEFGASTVLDIGCGTGTFACLL